MKGLLIKGGTVVTETEEKIADILIADGRIKTIGENSAAADPPDTTVIDAAGKIVIPGGVDVHTHLCLDVGFTTASDDFYTGTVAAACGGTTTIVDHPGFGPANCALDHQIKKYHGLAESKAVIDYSFHGVLQHVDDDVLRSMATLADEGITSYKVYLTYDYKLSDGDVFRVLEQAKKHKLIITVHPENDGVIALLRSRLKQEGKLSPRWHPRSRPAECEAEAVNRMILFAKMAGDAPLYIVHLSNALGLEFIRNARNRGQQNIYAETCPQYLFLDDSLYDGTEENGLNTGLKYIMCPPLRTQEDQASLWGGLQKDIQAIATDHCPFFFKTQKSRGKDDFTQCPSGAPGIEERIPLMFSEGVMKKRISLRRFTDLCAANPAKIFGMYPQKGVIKEGSDADMVIMDPHKKWTLRQDILHSNVDYSAYEGMELIGYPEYTISRGDIVAHNGEFTGTVGRGKFITRKTGVY
ncbi:dihydropyrimidinase [Spirochaetia bacterium]|nr:dihydropyrimidinase [Spirochaetia bacterium]